MKKQVQAIVYRKHETVSWNESPPGVGRQASDGRWGTPASGGQPSDAWGTRASGGQPSDARGSWWEESASVILPAKEVEQIDPDEKEYGERMKENQNDIYEVWQSTDWKNSKYFKYDDWKDSKHSKYGI